MSELRWEPPGSGSNRASSTEPGNGGRDGPSRWSVSLLVFVMLGAAFALGIGVMRLIDEDDSYGRFIRSSRGGEIATPAPVATERDDEEEPVGEETATATRASRFALLDEIYDVLDRDFVEPETFESIDVRKAAIQGIIDALGDPHTVFIDAEDYRLTSEDIGGSFEGIGATVQEIDGQIVISRPFSGSPAEQAGIRPGDIILEVDGESTEGWSIQFAVQVIRGPRGTDVELLVRHTDGTEELIVITRDRIVVPSVGSLAITDRSGQPVADIGYVYISQFTERTRDELLELLEAAENAGLTKLIIDVRGNPGGLLRATVDTVGEFVDNGVILRQINRDGSEEEFSDEPGGAGVDLELAVLIDRGSASGSEVMAAALRDYGRAVLIGETTSGKGTVNVGRRLSDGSVLYVSIARYVSPDGDPVEGVGVVPDIAVVQPETGFEAELDVVLQTAIDYLRGEWSPAPADSSSESEEETGTVGDDDEEEGTEEDAAGDEDSVEE